MFDRESWSYTGYASVSEVVDYSDQYSTSYPASAAVDGDTGTRWRTNNPAGAYIIVKLTKPLPISSLEWYVGSTSYYATSFTVSGSNDGENFDDLYSGGCAATSGWQVFNWENTAPYLYIKVTCNTCSSSRLYTYELKFGFSETLEYDITYGKYIVAVFDGPVTAPIESDANHFTVKAQIPIFGEDGFFTLGQTTRKISTVIPHPEVPNALLIVLDTTERLDECWYPAALLYDGSGSLTGYGRPIEAFEVEFHPRDIAYKGDQNDAEHIEIKQAQVTDTLTRIYYKDYTSGSEHIEISNMTVTDVLTHIDNI